MIHLTPIGPWSEKMETSEIRTAATSRNAKLLAVGDKSHTIKLLRRDLAHRTDALHSVAKRRTFRVELIVQFLCSFPSTQRGASFKEYRGHATAIAGLSFAYQDTHLVSIGGVTPRTCAFPVPNPGARCARESVLSCTGTKYGRSLLPRGTACMCISLHPCKFRW